MHDLLYNNAYADPPETMKDLVQFLSEQVMSVQLVYYSVTLMFIADAARYDVLRSSLTLLSNVAFSCQLLQKSEDFVQSSLYWIRGTVRKLSLSRLFFTVYFRIQLES